MIYTFAKRRALNKALRKLYPSHVFLEDKTGVPRMHTESMPENAVLVTSEEDMKERANLYWMVFQEPIPVFVTYYSEPYIKPRLIEVNYVSHQSVMSMDEALKYIVGRRLYTIPTSNQN